MIGWNNGVYTIKGLSLLSKITQGQSLKITRAVLGTGYVPYEQLANQTAVTGEKQELRLQTVTYPERGMCKLPMFVDNSGVMEGYTAKQLGVYVNDPEQGEILYFITQSEKGTEILTEAEMPGYSATWTLYFRYGQADTVEITVDPSNAVTPDMLEDIRKENETAFNAALISAKEYTDDAIEQLVLDNTSGGVSASAGKLAVARSIQTNLENTTKVMFDGTADVTPGVIGTLPLTNGGTGATTAELARVNLGAAATGHAHNLNASTITGYVPITKGGTGATTAAAALANLGTAPIESGTGQLGFVNVPNENFLTKFSQYQIVGKICTVYFYFEFQKTPTNPVTIVVNNLPLPPNITRPAASFVMCEGLKSFPSPQVASVMPLNGSWEMRCSNGQASTAVILNTAQFQSNTKLHGHITYEIAQ